MEVISPLTGHHPDEQRGFVELLAQRTHTGVELRDFRRAVALCCNQGGGQRDLQIELVLALLDPIGQRGEQIQTPFAVA